MFLSEFSIKRPIVTSVLALALMFFGYSALKNLKTNQNPDVEPPYLFVSINYPGASPETMEREVIERIESAMTTIPGLVNLNATARESNASFQMEFEFDKNMLEASQQVRDSIASVRDKLPTDMKEPIIEKEDTSQQPVLIILLSSKTKSLMDLSLLAEDDLSRQLRAIAGVSQAEVYGGLTRELTVQLHSDKLRQHSVSVAEVLTALRSQNLSLPVGRVQGEMAEQSIRLRGRLVGVKEFERIVVKRIGDDAIRLGQVATVVDGAAEQRSIGLYNGQPAVSVAVYKARDASTIEVSDRIKKRITELEDTYGKDVTMSVLFDQGKSVSNSLRNVVEALVLGALLTIVVVFVFLNSWRSTFITALALPTSVLAAFIAVWACGFTLNFMSLLGLSLAIGVLIDDAIVVRENIVRHMEMGKDKLTASRDGTNEIGTAVIATTFAIIAVFIPVAFMDGISGQWFKPFGLTVAFSVLVSLFISFSLDPMLSAYWGDPHSQKGAHRNALGRLLERFNDWFEHQADRYGRVISWALKHRISMWALAWGTFFYAIWLIMAPNLGHWGLSTSFLPVTDSGMMRIEVRTPSGSSLEYTKRKTEQAAELARLLPETDYTRVNAGSGGSFTRGNVMVKLKPIEERTRSAQELAVLLRQDIKRVVGAEYAVIDNMNGGGGKPLQIQFHGPDSRKLTELATAYIEKLKQIPGAVDVSLTSEDPKPELQIELDRALASNLGISMNDAATALRVAFAGVEVGDWVDPTGKTREVSVRLAPDERATVDDLARLPIVPGNGNSVVPLEQIASIGLGRGPAQIEHWNREKVVGVSANVEGRAFGEVNGEAKKLAQSMAFPPGYGFKEDGQGRDQSEVFGAMMSALGLGVLLMYFILVMQFHSFLAPVPIMLSLLLSLIGVVLGLLVGGSTLNLMSLIGVIMLMGLVAKNAILLIDYARKLEHEGVNREEALVAAGKARLRPILMTTFALIAGMLPVAIGLGEGSEFYKPLGMAIIGGTITSTVLTLLVVPTFYDSFETRKDKTLGWFRRRLHRESQDTIKAM